MPGPRRNIRPPERTRARLESVVSCLDVARRHRLIGRAKKLPRDLSTNRKHLEGFGE